MSAALVGRARFDGGAAQADDAGAADEEFRDPDGAGLVELVAAPAPSVMCGGGVVDLEGRRRPGSKEILRISVAALRMVSGLLLGSCLTSSRAKFDRLRPCAATSCDCHSKTVIRFCIFSWLPGLDFHSAIVAAVICNSSESASLLLSKPTAMASKMGSTSEFALVFDLA